MYRIATNVRAFQRQTTWSPLFAIFGWMLPPFVLYVIPFLMLRELWKASDSEQPRRSGELAVERRQPARLGVVRAVRHRTRRAPAVLGRLVHRRRTVVGQPRVARREPRRLRSAHGRCRVSSPSRRRSCGSCSSSNSPLATSNSPTSADPWHARSSTSFATPRPANAGSGRATTSSARSSKAGWKQAHALGKRLQKKGATELVSSPYLRCIQTLEPLASALEVPVLADERLLEGAGFEGALELLDRSRPTARCCAATVTSSPRRCRRSCDAAWRSRRLPIGARAPSGCSSETTAASRAAPSGHRRPDLTAATLGA